MTNLDLTKIQDGAAKTEARRRYMFTDLRQAFLAGARWARLPDPTKGCCCKKYKKNHGEGRIEHLLDLNPACPEHSDLVYDPRTGTWIHRTDVED